MMRLGAFKSTGRGQALSELSSAYWAWRLTNCYFHSVRMAEWAYSLFHSDAQLLACSAAVAASSFAALRFTAATCSTAILLLEVVSCYACPRERFSQKVAASVRLARHYANNKTNKK